MSLKKGQQIEKFLKGIKKKHLTQYIIRGIFVNVTV